MSKNIKALWLAIFSTILFTYCEHPSEFKRDKRLEIDDVNFTVKIIKPEQNETISEFLEIRVEAVDTSIQFVFDSLQILIDNSLITSSKEVPFDYYVDAKNLNNGNLTLTCKVYNWNETFSEKSVQFNNVSNNSLEISILESKTIELKWELVLNFDKYIIIQSKHPDMSNSEVLATIIYPSPLSYITGLDRLFFQIIAVNEEQDSVKSNIKGLGKSLVKSAHQSVNSGGTAIGVTTVNNNTIFLSCYYDGLRAYAFNGSELINTAHINNGGEAQCTAVGSDGTIFLANGADGLRAYTYDGTKFTNTAHINSSENNLGKAKGVAVGKDGTIYLANGLEGLHAYTYDGSKFTNTAYINSSENNNGEALSVAVGNDGTVYLANGQNGLLAYKYNGTEFANTLYLNNGGYAFSVAVGADGKIYLANGATGLKVYTYDGVEFTKSPPINNGDYARGVAVGIGDEIFVAYFYNGLQAYEYDSSELSNTAHINNEGNAEKVALGSDGTIYLASNYGGLYAYVYKWIIF
jgi:hypothetical protein